jgi:heme exporter protein A
MGDPVTATVSLRLDDISIVRGDRTLISALSIYLDRPQVLWVEGGNGVGKTSLLRTSAGLSKPEAGQVSWQLNEQTVTAPEVVAWLPTEPQGKPTLNLGEDATFWGASRALETLELLDHVKTPTERLSTGQSKRLALAKLIASDKPLWILDEPLAGLDAEGRERVAGLLRDHVRCGGIALVASHAPIHLPEIHQQRLRLSGT